MRYRGLHFPRDTAILTRDIARQMEAVTWQPSYTEAAFALATARDRAVVLGAGTGHIPAILAGKLGLRHVWLCDDDAARRAYVARLAHTNGLPRLGFIAVSDLRDVAPTLLFADLTCMPELPALPQTLRACALHLPATPDTETIPFASITTAGLAYHPPLSSGRTLVFLRQTMDV